MRYPEAKRVLVTDSAVHLYVCSKRTAVEEETKSKPAPATEVVKKVMTAKEETVKVANNGWGELFQDRKTFVEMHHF